VLVHNPDGITTENGFRRDELLRLPSDAEDAAGYWIADAGHGPCKVTLIGTNGPFITFAPLPHLAPLIDIRSTDADPEAVASASCTAGRPTTHDPEL
jgi:hypothetical protein